MKKLQHFFSSRKSWVLPYLIFSVIFVIIPLLLIVVYAFTDDMGHLTLANFSKFFAHSESVNTFVYSIGIAILTTLGCILLGYPVAWILNNSKNLSYSRTLIMLFILPMWVNILVRTLATVALFDFCRLPLGEGALIFGMNHDGIHAYYFDFCHCRAVDHEQYQAFRNYHTGKYKQQLVELRSSSFAHHVVPYCRNFLVYSRK